MNTEEVLLSSETFYMDCIENKYILFNLYVHSHLKYTHLIIISLKYILNIVKYEY